MLRYADVAAITNSAEVDATRPARRGMRVSVRRRAQPWGSPPEGEWGDVSSKNRHVIVHRALSETGGRYCASKLVETISTIYVGGV